MITVNYFGTLAEAAQSDSEALDLQAVSVAELVDLLDAKYGLRKFQFQVAVNRKIISKKQDIQLTASDEIALLPPFSGG
ncbi:MoaD/ThiS family protein [Algoriphagus halophytocola]|uniref:Molybdopterin synthase sulfur carrier subunit n=1 Tax=Algoriphagus halophytocola TaxID=2991499 RepID=A0ABY6MEV9_9BACT|nr:MULTISPECIES: MoaD/ThiS family protein [unclassified Algoriphagus]UZD21494.1 MoaD/ThiS family protein [Algoriphagus sp. TR-M5]WBL42706.1 MoaD/ThiS family protein [Algoriphagus sp. TR-M9]